jgi:hypothetical protein
VACQASGFDMNQNMSAAAHNGGRKYHRWTWNKSTGVFRWYVSGIKVIEETAADLDFMSIGRWCMGYASVIGPFRLTGKFGRVIGYDKAWVPAGTDGLTSIETALIAYWGEPT